MQTPEPLYALRRYWVSGRTDSLRLWLSTKLTSINGRLLSDEKVPELNVRVANLEQDVRHVTQIVETLE